MIKMSTNIQYFCKLVAMGYEPIEAIGISHKKINTYTQKLTVTEQLMSHPKIVGEIDRQRELLFNPIAIRRKLISLHNMCMDFNPSDCFEIKAVYDKDGNEIGTRVSIKSISSWSPIARKLFKGFDKNGYPTFREPEKAMSELSRLYGFYKETQSTIEDTDAVINGALGVVEEVLGEIEDLDTVDLDEMLRPYENGTDMKEVVSKAKEGITRQHNFDIPTIDTNIVDEEDSYHYKKMMSTREWRKKKEIAEIPEGQMNFLDYEDDVEEEEETEYEEPATMVEEPEENTEGTEREIKCMWLTDPEEIAKMEAMTRRTLEREKQMYV